MVADAGQGHAAPPGLRSIVGGFSINMSLLTELAPAYIEGPIYNLLKSSANLKGLKNPACALAKALGGEKWIVGCTFSRQCLRSYGTGEPGHHWRRHCGRGR